MILAAGLSPAWQQTVLLESLKTGEVNRAREAHWCASGKVLNVGLAVACLNRGAAHLLPLAVPGDNPAVGRTHSRAESPAPARHSAATECQTLALVGGVAGAEIEREFAGLNVPATWIRSASGTRICTTLLDALSGETTEIVENARPLAPGDLESFRAAWHSLAPEADVLVVTGSFPAGVPVDLYAQLLQSAPGRSIVDAQGPSLSAALAARPLVIKPNREELGRTLGRSLISDRDLRLGFQECHARGAQWVVMTQGAGPVWVSSADRVVQLVPPRVSVVNPIGSGDCLAAGLAWGLAAGWSMVDAVRLGVAAATDNVGRLLPARLEVDRMASLFFQVEVHTD